MHRGLGPGGAVKRITRPLYQHLPPPPSPQFCTSPHALYWIRRGLNYWARTMTLGQAFDIILRYAHGTGFELTAPFHQAIFAGRFGGEHYARVGEWYAEGDLLTVYQALLAHAPAACKAQWHVQIGEIDVLDYCPTVAIEGDAQWP